MRSMKRVRKQVHKILEEQKKRGALIIIACHDKEELEMLSDEIIEIYEGRIVARGKRVIMKWT